MGETADKISPAEVDKYKTIKKNLVSSKSLLVGRKSMIYIFLPWIISWNLIGRNYQAGILMPLLITLALVFWKIKLKLELTFLEKTTILYFTFLTVSGFFIYDSIQSVGIQVNYFSMAAIWLISILFGNALTIDYSKHEYDEETIKTPIFRKINVIITMIWVAVFIVQGVSVILLIENDKLYFAPLVYLFFIIGFVLTKILSG